MGVSEPKKLALLRIYQILHDYSDCDHPLTQEEIVKKLNKEYGIDVDRKTVGRNLSLLKEADYDIGTSRGGSYLVEREFLDSELRILIDGILASKYVEADQTEELINRICALSNRYFKSRIKHVSSANDLGKTENKQFFYNIETVDIAIESNKKIQYDFNKYDINKKLTPKTTHTVSPYLMRLKNQKYYLMGYNDTRQRMENHRLDHITNMKVLDEKRVPLNSISGYEKGIDYKLLASAYPYMYSDKPERVTFLAKEGIIDQIIEWFGKDITMTQSTAEKENGDVKVSLLVSPMAMKYWAIQYVNAVEILTPETLRADVIADLEKGLNKYKGIE